MNRISPVLALGRFGGAAQDRRVETQRDRRRGFLLGGSIVGPFALLFPTPEQIVSVLQPFRNGK